MFRINVVEKIKTHFLFSNFLFENREVYEIMWENIVVPGRRQIIWRMRFACWICKAINTHSDCQILIAFTLQQWLHERASILRYTRVGPQVSGLTYKSRAKWKILRGIYSAICGEVNVSVSVCVEIKGDYIEK
jgi:hypothetical protein